MKRTIPLSSFLKILHNQQEQMNFFSKKQNNEKFLRYLLTVNDDRGVETFVLEASVYSIGRDSINAIVIHSDSVSRQHAILLRMPNPDKSYCYLIQDGNLEGKSSANGIIVNGNPTKKYYLKDGDEVALGGKVTLIYRTAFLSDIELEEKVTHPEYRTLKGSVVSNQQTIQADLNLNKDAPTAGNISKPETKDRSNIKQEIDIFRQCFEMTNQELKHLKLSNSENITIALSIYQKLKSQ